MVKPDRIFAAEKESCIIMEKTFWEEPSKRACIKVCGKSFSLPLVLIKLFREGFGEFTLNNLTVYSRPDCALSRLVTFLRWKLISAFGCRIKLDLLTMVE